MRRGRLADQWRLLGSNREPPGHAERRIHVILRVLLGRVGHAERRVRMNDWTLNNGMSGAHGREATWHFTI